MVKHLKAIALLCFFTMFMCKPCNAQVSFTYPDIYDINNDGNVDVVDINLIVSDILTGKTADSNPVTTDVNKDGIIDINDLAATLRMIIEAPGAAITWIDDDHGFFNWKDEGRLGANYKKIHEFCMETGIRFDIARGSLCTPYDFKVLQFQLDECLKWQSEGFNYLYHPNHSMGWYDYDSEHPHDASKIEESAMDCINGFAYYGFNAPDILVWPGDSHKFKDNYPVVKRLYECAISASYIGTNTRAVNDRYCLQRFSLECLKAGYLTKTQFKQQLKEAVDRGDWIILASHIVHLVDSDVPDETSYNFANFLEIIQYADSLCHIRPTGEVWAERKWMWEAEGR